MESAFIAHLEGNYILVAGDNMGYENIVFPIPIFCNYQIPISLDINADNPELVSKIALRKRDDSNWIVDLILNPMSAKQELNLDWKCLVLILDNGDNDKSTDDVDTYLTSSLCVQSEHPEIQKKAFSLADPNKDLIKTVKNTLSFLQEVKFKSDGNYKGLDALEALYHGGSCVSAANLTTALLRANGIPARILATHPTWFGRHQTHYIIEAFIQDNGWVSLEPCMNRTPEPPQNNITVSVIRLEDENNSILRWIYWQGVPYLSLPEKLTSGDIGFKCPPGGPHKAQIIKTIEVDGVEDNLCEFVKENYAYDNASKVRYNHSTAGSILKYTGTWNNLKDEYDKIIKATF